ncbi:MULTISPECIES: hypothetical protein [Streptomyces]|uniref:Peptidase inhibitor family I36 n=1 Tax=Streptomyces dengpaensis TaxID=2049881 RepID=A0ABM6SPG2_9ACTN|nr:MULTISPECIES: hypothetical protein [Streptomyces]AVH56480.1 hypothetical protein C4B68_12620 [Streptomyces dengpaensis]PIB10491.1 hypothetical protein B1C81_08475 [Streptomyces sp. HG99]
MIAKRNRPKAVVGIAAAAMALGALSAAPAQASTSCNSTRLCWYQPNGNITNVDLSLGAGVPSCGGDGFQYPGAIGNYYVRNRSDSWHIHLYYDYNGDGSVTSPELVIQLGPGDTEESAATLNPNSRYYYCKV